VMNEQRKIVYSQRQQVLEGENLREIIYGMFRELVREALRDIMDPRSGSEEDPSEFLSYLRLRYGIQVEPEELKGKELDEAVELIFSAYREIYEEKVAQIGEERMEEIERFILLARIDERWKDHLYAMDQLRHGIGLRAVGQLDPKVAYKREGYELFQQMIAALRQDVTELVLKVEVRKEDESRLGRAWRNRREIHEEAPRAEVGVQAVETPREREGGRLEPIRNVGVKIGRNDPCPCGSGKKYKKCHGRFA